MLQAVVKAFPILILLVNEDGTILDYTSEDPSLYYIHPEKFLNQQLKDVFPRTVAGQFEEALRTIKQRGQPAPFHYSLQLEDGKHWFETRFMASSKPKSTIIIQDVTKYKKTENKIQIQLEQMSALRRIDLAIASNMDLNQTLSVLLNQVISHLHIDAAAILLWNSHKQTMDYATGIGFLTEAMKHTSLRLGEGYAGVAAQKKRVVHIENLPSRKTDFLRSPYFLEENFVSYFGIPLITKNQVQGVLEIFKRSSIDPTPEWLNFLETLGGQAAIAIENAMLFYGLQKSNSELTLAYEATIKGWSRALELRDHETEGHTQRVTELSLRLARRVGIDEREFTNIQRGAILHDIGKIGIPDRILRKPAPLNEEEWAVMRQHTNYARELISQIQYLAPAMEIPCYHHERWNGTGYPLGLRGEEIPLSARMFAIIDVFDALTSDRPYRNAWSIEKALEYIRSQAGILFDPNITVAFLAMMEEEVVFQ